MTDIAATSTADDLQRRKQILPQRNAPPNARAAAAHCYFYDLFRANNKSSTTTEYTVSLFCANNARMTRVALLPYVSFGDGGGCGGGRDGTEIAPTLPSIEILAKSAY